MATEKRLIDATTLKALFADRYDRAFMQMHSREEREYWDGVCCGVNWGQNTITDAPTVDAVEVVRCKDCKHYHTHNRSVRFDCKELYCCRSALKKVAPEDFCSFGERKGNG